MQHGGKLMRNKWKVWKVLKQVCLVISIIRYKRSKPPGERLLASVFSGLCLIKDMFRKCVFSAAISSVVFILK